MSATDPITAESRRFSIRLPRPLWIGLATAVLVVVTVSVEFVVPIWRRQVAIRELQRLGGQIEIQHAGPEWLRQRLGDEHMKYFNKVVKVDLSVRSVNDQTLRQLAALSDLKVIWLGNSQITDDGIVYLRRLNSLEQLWLGNTRVTDAGLVHLEKLRNLNDLSLGNTRVSDAGLVHLVGIRNLQQLSLGNTRVSDSGVAELQRALPSLKIFK